MYHMCEQLQYSALRRSRCLTHLSTPMDAAAPSMLGGRAECPRLGLEADGRVLGVDGVGGLGDGEGGGVAGRRDSGALAAATKRGRVAGERVKEGVIDSGRLLILGRIRAVDIVEGAAGFSEGGRGQLCLELGRGDRQELQCIT